MFPSAASVGGPVAAALRLADHGGIPGDGVGRSGDGGPAEGGRAGQHGQEERRQGTPTADARVARRKLIRAHTSPPRPARREGRAGSSGLPRLAARVRPKAAARNVGRGTLSAKLAGGKTPARSLRGVSRPTRAPPARRPLCKSSPRRERSLVSV